MKTKILTLLRNSQDYISGQELCDAMGVSRTAIWKVMNQLKEEGYEIVAIQNKGYKLVSYPDVLSASEIGSRLKGKWTGSEIHFFQETGSTNNDAKKMAEEGCKNGTLIVANRQLAGRGRRGRTWESPADTSVYMTLVLRPTFPPDKASMLTLVMALSATKALEEITGLLVKIKWPNDIIINNKKICGILTEMNAEPDFIHYVVIGMGTNVNMNSFPEELADKASSLKIETGRTVNRTQVIAKVMEYFEEVYESFLQTLDLTLLMEEYNAHLANKDARVKVLDPKEEFEGIARGINEFGELIVEKENGEITLVFAGEVSVRGIYGYL